MQERVQMKRKASGRRESGRVGEQRSVGADRSEEGGSLLPIKGGPLSVQYGGIVTTFCTTIRLRQF